VSTLLVASTGGHLAELHELRNRLQGVDDDRVWVTFDTAQSRSLLKGENVIHVDFTAPRDLHHVLTNSPVASRLLKRDNVSSVVSTGAAVAMSFLPIARARGIATHYIESAARTAGPSLTGRMVRHLPGVKLYAQYPGWAHKWQYRGSVFDAYKQQERTEAPQLRRAVVALGAQPDFGFRRLVQRLVRLIPPETEVLWQTGATNISGLGINARPFIPQAELSAAMEEADLVVSHAGVGCALDALHAGRSPVLVPRDPHHGEHVDDHQMNLAAAMSSHHVATVRHVEQLTTSDLLEAAAHKVVRRDEPPAFQLNC
jgi:UDP-N-acetylglucosamine--N-acetylmuramyl-(pentapeptide) pyrophosphoryl-undecaprenol N-acetylglucosamine transferase